MRNKACSPLSKWGDWGDVESDYSAGLCFDGGIECVIGLHTELTDAVDVGVTVTAVDVHFLMYSRKERRIVPSRMVVIPTPFKTTKVNLRKRKDKASASKHVLQTPPVKSSIGWLNYCLETRRH